MNTWKRVAVVVTMLFSVLLVGTVGYVILGFSWLDALYQTVTTVFTVGFREIEPFDTAGKVFTMVLIAGGVGTALYSLSVLVELVIEGHLSEYLGRRRMDRDINRLSGHTIVCGWGRVGRTIAQYLEGLGQSVVVVDSSEDRLERCTFPAVCGDATSDDSLDLAGVSRAKSVVAAVADDAENLFIVVSARALRPDLFIVARIRSEQNETKMLRAGADRVVNPQQIGGARMAAFVHQPHVAEFLDVVMHDGSLEFRLADDEPASEYHLVGRGCADRSWYRGATRRAPICCWHVSAGGRAAGVLP